MSGANFTVNEALPPMDRITDATDYIFAGSAGLEVVTLDIEGIEAQVVLTAESVGDEANAIGLSRYANGRVVYEHHTTRQVPILGGIGAPHIMGCIPNLGRDCVKLDVNIAEQSMQAPRFEFGTTEPVRFREITGEGHTGVAQMVERFAAPEQGYADFCQSRPEAREAIVAMGGARFFFRDPAMRKFVASAVDLHG